MNRRHLARSPPELDAGRPEPRHRHGRLIRIAWLVVLRDLQDVRCRRVLLRRFRMCYVVSHKWTPPSRLLDAPAGFHRPCGRTRVDPNDSHRDRPNGREVRGGHGRTGAVSTRQVRPEAQVTEERGECYAASIRPPELDVQPWWRPQREVRFCTGFQLRAMRANRPSAPTRADRGRSNPGVTAITPTPLPIRRPPR